MRLGEQKNIIDRLINDDKHIVINHTPLYGGQAQKISNFGDVLASLEILAELEWNTQDYSTIDSLVEKYGKVESAQVETAEFDQLNSYISTLNQKLPFYYSVLETMTEEQDEKTINIKLPVQEGQSLEDLSNLHGRLDKELKKFQVDGGFEFKSFDKGSDWLVIIPVGVLTYRFFMACLKLSQEYFKTKTEYFKSEEAEISYKTQLKHSKEEDSEKMFKTFQKEWMGTFIEEGIRGIVAKIGQTNGETEASLSSKLVKATKGLIALLDENIEFHPSLNPPEYIEGTADGISIDYEKLQELTSPAEEVLELETPEEDPNESKDE